MLSIHMRRHFASWFLFLTDASVPPSNWEVEQAIRPAVVNRKVWGGNPTESGAKAQGVLSSVSQTCKKQAKAALDFVSQTKRAFGNRLLPTPMLPEPANQLPRKGLELVGGNNSSPRSREVFFAPQRPFGAKNIPAEAEQGEITLTRASDCGDPRPQAASRSSARDPSP
jgi:transposase